MFCRLPLATANLARITKGHRSRIFPRLALERRSRFDNTDKRIRYSTTPTGTETVNERATMAITHIVLFEFKPTISHEKVEQVRHDIPRPLSPILDRDVYQTPKKSITHSPNLQVCKHMLSLPDQCKHPSTSGPYVTGHGGGRNTSPEGIAVVVNPHAFLSYGGERTYLFRLIRFSRAGIRTRSSPSSRTKRIGSTTLSETRRTWSL